jgi:NTP pyrophosphatase (non-canonical NTP hydrolase)
MKIPKRVAEISRREKKSLVSRGLKLNEEAGELAAEILKLVGEKGAKGKTQKEILADLHLEAVDCMLMAMDILVHTGATEKVIAKIMKKQLNKWEKNFK